MSERMAPEDAVAAAGERAVLETFLDRYREIVVRKVAGVSDVDARRALVPSGNSIGGLVKHLRWVETGWFHRVLAGSGDNRREHERSTEFVMTDDETLDGLVSAYRAACQRSREIAAPLGLDDLLPHRHLGQVSARWVYVHMIEETARHAGHLDIMREHLDGSTGFA